MHLLGFDPAVQEAVLMQVRTIVAFWEAQGYVFDPVAYEGVLLGLVPILASLCTELLLMWAETASLNVRLVGAEHLIERLREANAEGQ
jgi:hypothetical protein